MEYKEQRKRLIQEQEKIINLWRSLWLRHKKRKVKISSKRYWKALLLGQ